MYEVKVPIVRVSVASFMGAWIEISQTDGGKVAFVMSHPSWVRGLKS